MATIVKLNEWIISRLALEQLINSYVDIVKELVDNSIDGASEHIKIYVNFNDNSVEVIDDGIGMSEEDLKLCILPHSTSKFSDFSNLKYLGFRGEGLHAIKESSNLDIITRMDDELYGHCLYSNGMVERISSNKGTTVKVSNIFYNTPRKHLFINKKTEFVQIINFIQQMALSHQNIKFTLFRNGVHYMSLGQTDNIINEVFHIHSYERISIKDNSFNLEIYFNKKPKEKKGKLMLFVNKRPVMDISLLSQIKKAIEQNVGEKNLCFLLVFLTIDPAHVDFNITPSKNRVKISILDHIKSRTEQYFQTPMNQHSTLLKETEIPMNYNILNGWFAHKNKFIFAEYNGKVYVLDQHAISERILLNQLLKETYDCQMLLEKISIGLTEEEKFIFNGKQENLKSLKFLFHQVDNYLLIYGIPSFLPVEEVTNTIKQFLNEEDFHIFLHKVSEIACKNSIKGGYRLRETELKEFLSKIINNSDCAFCNHGRRTHIIIEDRQIVKWFDIQE